MPDRNADRDKVLAASDIVEVVGEHVQLRAKGREFAAVCCFHDDTKPSMYVSPQKQIFKCFACGAGGSVFDFVMKYHKLTFPEALKYLADRAGIELTPWKKRGGDGKKKEGPSDRERQSEANVQALGFYTALLQHPEHGQHAREYLHGRGVSKAMIQAFGIGVAPDRWDGLATMVGHKHWDIDAFVSIGLIKPRKGTPAAPPEDQPLQPGAMPKLTPEPADCYDLLRHRLIFPIYDQLGRPVAFGGRKLRDEDEPKYLNSPESEVFKKAGTLYGLHAAKKTVIDTKTAVMVEGYTDVIACHQAGATNVVAALGTALTPEHAKVLKRFCEKVVLVMDGDEAGQRAADRAIEVFLTAEVDVFLATIPGGADPDELLKQDDGLAQWNTLVDNAKDALEWQFDRLAEQLDAAGTVTGRQRLAEAFAQRIVDAGLARVGSLRRALVVQRLSELLGLDRDAVSGLLKSYKPRPRYAERVAPPRPAAPSADNSDVPPADVYDGLQAESEPDGDLDFDPGLPEGASATPFSDSGAAAPAETGASGSGGVVNQGNQDESDVASGLSRGRLVGLQKAEQRVLAALLTDPALFQTSLPDGRSIDESIAPAEFVTDIHRGVYQRLFDALCDGQTPTLSTLLAELSESGETAASDAVTAADAELAALMEPHLDEHGNPNPEALRETLLDAVGVLLAFQEQRRFEQTKRELTRQGSADAPTEPHAKPQVEAAALDALLDQLRTAGSPKRIGKPRTA
ncbi:MAG: CHC2 zinc finger domain-containing protein [Planctomycetota bacterium]